jgi:hypothetical protein
MVLDRFGGYENAYLEKIKHQIRKSRKGEISDFGIKAISKDENPKSFKWCPVVWHKMEKSPEAHHTN